ncbi:hypothetical protein BH10CYA1_BH10CYA1_28710 [soil metagenome]
MQIHPLVTVKKAASALGVDREVIRNMIDIGAVRGERRFIKNKEKWFLYQEEVQEYLEKRALELSEQATRTTMEGLGEFFAPTDEAAPQPQLDLNAVEFELSGAELEINGVELEINGVELELNGSVLVKPEFLAQLLESESMLVTEVDEDEDDHPDRMYLQTEQHSLDQMLHSLTIEFAHRLCEERQIICNLKQQLDERNQLLAGIPDLRQKLDEVKSLQQSRDAEIKALKANITALESDLSWSKKPWWNRLFSL